jgi:hypothetical protein
MDQVSESLDEDQWEEDVDASPIEGDSAHREFPDESALASSPDEQLDLDTGAPLLPDVSVLFGRHCLWSCAVWV